MKNNHFTKVNLQADKDVIAAGKSGKRIVEIKLIAPPEKENRPHVPLNLALVLDRSGSMHGEKLHYVKDAALHVVDLMTEADRVAVVIYDDMVETLMPSQFLTSTVKKELKERIKKIETGASTNLYGGWVTGSRQVAEVISERTFNRTLLLTDGLANVGVRDVGTLSMHAQELFSRGISTSCFGAGADYDEYLLEAMANLGGGNFHFLETAQAIPLVFEREFDEIISMVLKDVKITLTLPEAVSAHVAGNWYAKREGNSLVITLGSLATEQEQSVYLTLDNLVSSNGNMIEIPVAVTGIDRDQNPQEVRAMMRFKSLPEVEEAAQPQDAGLMERFAVVDLAYKTSQALKLERDGERDAGVRFLRQSLTSHRGNISEETFSKYKTMSNKMYLGLDKAERKRRHYEQYTSQRGWQSIRDYPLHFVNGALMAEIDGLSALVHSSGGDSFSRVAEWFFLDDVYKLPQSHNELSLDKLAKSMGVQVDLVMGMDILKDLYVRIDPYRMLISFSRKPLPSSGWRVDLDKLDSIWACSLNLAGVEQRMRLMTAAGLSFVPENLTTGLKPEGHQQVHWLNLPAFETPVFRLKATFGEKSLPVMCGILPGEVQKTLGLGASDGILGGAFFEGVPSTLAFPDRKWIIYI